MVEIKKELKLSSYDVEHVVFKLSKMQDCIDQMSDRKKVKNNDLIELFMDLVDDLNLYDDFYEKKTFYVLPLDQYNQPAGTVEMVCMTKREAAKLSRYGYYIYDNYEAALQRAEN